MIRHKKIKENKISEPDSFDLNQSAKIVTVKNVLFILFEFQQTRWASRSKPRLRSQDVRSLALHRKRIPKRKFTSLYPIKNCQVLVNWSFEFRLSLSKKTVYVAVAVLYETAYLSLQLGTSSGVACVAAVSFPFLNARGKLRKSGKISSRGRGCDPLPLLTHPLPTSLQFFGLPQACSFARPLFVRLFDLCAAWKRKGIGCYAGYLRGIPNCSRTDCRTCTLYIVCTLSVSCADLRKDTFTGHSGIMTPIHMTVCSSS